MKIEEVDINEIIPYKNNPREISQESITKVAESIKQFGNNQPIVVDNNNIIVVGHTRWKALKQLGKTKAFIIKKDFSKNDAIAYRIMDNRSSENNKWETNLLNQEIEALKLGNFDISLTGFDLEDFQIPFTNKIVSKNISDLKPHPKNYKKHPEDQLQHLINSIKENGIYRTIIISNDNYILAGHGVVEACKKLNLKKVPTLQLNIDSNNIKALKLLTADNEVSHLGEVNERELSEILKDILDKDTLLGTGYDEMMLSNLIFITRPKDEIDSINAAQEWVGLPEYERSVNPEKITVSFENKEDRNEFAKKLGIRLTEKTKSIWFPYREDDDVKSIEFTDEA
jgi:ParB-like chromosome segregation protein Spo0J